MYVASETFPEDILDAHQKLNSLLKNRGNREYFGISFFDHTGKIHYKAVVTENFKGESDSLNLKTFLLKKGNYNYIIIPNYKNDEQEIENAFKILILNANVNMDVAYV